MLAKVKKEKKKVLLFEVIISISGFDVCIKMKSDEYKRLMACRVIDRKYICTGLNNISYFIFF